MRPRMAFTKAWSFPKHRAPKPCSPRVHETDSAFGAGRFPKKSQSFAFSAFQISSKRQLD